MKQGLIKDYLYKELCMDFSDKDIEQIEVVNTEVRFIIRYLDGSVRRDSIQLLYLLEFMYDLTVSSFDY